MRQIKIVVEKHPDGYVAYPLGIDSVVVGEGDTYEEVLADVKSAIQFHIETFGQGVLEVESPAETQIDLSPRINAAGTTATSDTTAATLKKFPNKDSPALFS